MPRPASRSQARGQRFRAQQPCRSRAAGEERRRATTVSASANEQATRGHGFVLAMPDRPSENLQRRLDRLRAQRAEQIAKERQKSACTHDNGSELLALVARNGDMHVYTGCRDCHANLENGRFHPAREHRHHDPHGRNGPPTRQPAVSGLRVLRHGSALGSLGCLRTRVSTVAEDPPLPRLPRRVASQDGGVLPGKAAAAVPAGGVDASPRPKRSRRCAFLSDEGAEPCAPMCRTRAFSFASRCLYGQRPGWSRKPTG